jgi:predicted DNA-binding WGR domain protein
MDVIYLECTEGNHYKFWEAAIEVEVSGNAQLVTRWGRIGTAGQTREYTFRLVTAARSRLDSIVREKLNKGYREIIRLPSPVPRATSEVPDGSRQAALLLVELAIANRSSPPLVAELLRDIYRLVPELDGEEDLDSLRERLLALSVPVGF